MAPFDTFSCADQLIAICVGNDHLFGILASTLGKPELATDQRFATNVDRTGNQAELKAEMEKVLRTDTAEAWHERLEDAGIPVSLVLNVDDTRKLEQIKVRAMVKDVGGFQVPGNPIKFGAYNSLGTTIPSPELNNCGDALRAEFGPAEAGTAGAGPSAAGTADGRQPVSAPRPRPAPSDQQQAAAADR